MHFVEYIIPMPYNLEQYRIGYMWSQLQFSKMETGGGSGVEFVEEKKIEDPEPGRHTYRVYYLEKKFPKIVSKIIPPRFLQVHESSTSFINYTETHYTHESLSEDKFGCVLKSTSSPNELQNAFNLTPEALEKRKIVYVDITKPFNEEDTIPENDPTTYRSHKLSFGPLENCGWKNANDCPSVIYVHKLYQFNVCFPGFNQVKPKVIDSITRMIYKFYRNMWCWTDQWFGLTLQDLEALENEVRKDLAKLLESTEVRGIAS